MSLSQNLTEANGVDADKISLLSEESNAADGQPSKTPPKLSAKSELERLSVPQHFSADFRAPSPDTLSNLSVDEINERRRSRSPLYFPGSRQASRSRARPESIWGRAKEALDRFWIKNKGVALVLVSQVFGTLMNVTTRLLEVEGNNGKGLHPFQILFARMGITLVLASTYMWYTKTPDFPLGKKEVRSLLVARGIGGFFGVFGMYYSLLYLPLADATVITFLAPSLSCWACSYLIDEPFTRMEQLAAGISFGGVILIARPTSLFFGSSTHAPPASGDGDIQLVSNGTLSAVDASNYDNVTPAQRAGAVGLALLGVMGAVAAFTTIRWIGKRAHPLLSVNYFACWCTIVSTVMMLSLPNVGFLLPAGLKEWCYLFFLGICGFIMQFLLAAGLQYEKSSRATNMTYCQMLFALTFDKLIFGHTPDLLSIFGSSLILGSAIYVAVQKANAKSKETTEGRGRNSDEERPFLEGGELVEEERGRGPLEEVQLRTLRI